MKHFAIVNPFGETEYFTGQELINETNAIIEESHGYQVESVNEAIETLEEIGYQVQATITGAMENVISKY